MRSGKVIVIEGTDGSGKTEQTKRLNNRLQDEGYVTLVKEYPDYSRETGKKIAAYLQGSMGPADLVDPYKAAILYADNRREDVDELNAALENGKIIICNRYVTANMGHQAGKIADKMAIDRFLAWLDATEYLAYGLPRPNLTLLLHMPPHISQQFVDKKSASMREYCNGQKRDGHEGSLTHLLNAEKTFLYVAKERGWHVIECSDGNSAFPMDDIAEKVYGTVKKIL